MMFEAHALSDVGCLRHTNQDSGYAGNYLLVVADGMGGHAGGDVASRIAISHLAQLDRVFPSVADAKRELKKHILQANQLILDVVLDYPQLAGLGTTLSAMLSVGSTVVVAHIGDSRIYRLRDGSLKQLTHDHTFVQQLIDSGQITVEEAAVHPRRSVLMRVLGDVDAQPQLDLFESDARNDDLWLICSDGLSGVLSDDAIATVLTESTEIATVATRLIAESLDLGAPDNVTLVIGRNALTRSASESDSVEAVVGMFVGSASGDDPLLSLPMPRDAALTRGHHSSPSLPVSTDGIPVILNEASDQGATGDSSTSDAASDTMNPTSIRSTRSRLRTRVLVTIGITVVIVIVAVAVVLASTHGWGIAG